MICRVCNSVVEGAVEGSRCPRDGVLLVDPDALAANPHDLLLGQTVGEEFGVIGIIGRGAFGTVYRALQFPLLRPVALKVLHFQFYADEVVRQRFFHEARALAALSNPSVVTLIRYGEQPPGTPLIGSPGFLYIAQEFVHGRTLRAVIEEDAPLVPERAIALALQVLRGLAEAHRVGIVHRDLKPPNIIVVAEELGGERVKVLDFGIAKLLSNDPEESSLTTQSGLAMGTPDYMAPEQTDSRLADARADLYSLGVMLFEMVTGRKPYVAPTQFLLMIAHKGAPLPSLQGVEDAPPGLEAIVHRAMAKNPDHRFDSARQMAEALLALAASATLDTPVLPALVVRSPPVDDADDDDIQWADTPTRSVSAPIKTNLPAEVDSFVGRTEALTELELRVTETQRLITILGAGGTGKTRLSQRFGSRQIGAFPGGVWFCDLSEARTSAGVSSAVAAALDVPLTQLDTATQLADAIRARGRTLLILDNFEQVVDEAAEIVERWLRYAPEVVFLVTSRTLLRVAGEAVFHLDPLPVDEAMSLFYDRAHAVQPRFARTKTNTPVVQEIVQRLDCMALAIELTAARTRTLPPAQILTRLSQRFELLRGVRRDQTARQATLRGAIDWSWRLLPAPVQAALGQLSVFRGGFTLEAAEAVVDLGNFDDAPWVMDAVEALVDNCLLRQTEPIEGHARYRMLESIREYAAQQLPDDGGATSRRHAQHFASFGHEAFIESLDAHGGTARRRRLELELENLVRGWRAPWSPVNTRWPPGARWARRRCSY